MYSPFFNNLNADPLFRSNMNLMNSFESMLPMPPMLSLMPGQATGSVGMSGPGAGPLMPLGNHPLMGPMSAAGNLRPQMAVNQLNQNHPHPFNSFAPLPFFNMQSLLGNPMMSPQQNSFSSSTFVSMTCGPDGKPQVYKSSTSMKSGPGGVLETQHSEIDSVTGTKKMEIGHHIGDKSHIVEKKQNINTGDKEENEELVNLDEDELDGFKREWENKTRQPHRRHHEHLRISNTPKARSNPLALPPAVSQSPVANSQGTGRRLPHGASSGHVRKNRLMKSVSGHHERKV